MRKLRHWLVKWLAESHRASKWWWWDSKSRDLGSKTHPYHNTILSGTTVEEGTWCYMSMQPSTEICLGRGMERFKEEIMFEQYPKTWVGIWAFEVGERGEHSRQKKVHVQNTSCWKVSRGAATVFWCLLWYFLYIDFYFLYLYYLMHSSQEPKR